MDSVLVFIPTLAHFLIGFLFTFAGVRNIYHWRPILITMNEENIPHPWLLLPIGISWQIIAGVMIMCNIYVKLAALSLIPFTVISVLMFHPFWKFHGEMRSLNFSLFLVNITTTLAALFLLLCHVTPLTQLSDFLN
jgi:putative oxidoreductase